MKKCNLARIMILVLSLALLIGSAMAITVSAEETESASTGEFGNLSLAYGDKVALQVVVDATKEEIDNGTVKVTYSINGNEANATYYRTDDSGRVWVITEGIAVYDLAQTVTFNSYVGDTHVEENRTCSAAQFIYYRLYSDPSTTEVYKTLYNNLLAYAESAQIALNKNANALVTASTIVTAGENITVNGMNYAFAPAASLEITPVWTGEGTVEGWNIVDNGVEKTVGLTFTCSGNVKIVEPIFHIHTPGEVVVENNVAPGCETEGSYDNVVYCTDSECGEELSRETITVDATGHSYGDWSVVTAPTYYSTGTEVQSCACGATNERAVDKLVAPDNLVTSFDTADSLNTIKRYWAGCTLSIDNTIAHGDDKGSLKVQVSAVKEHYITLNTPLNGGDFGDYDYISFWVYNTGSNNITVGTTWKADTVCAPGQWTEVKVTRAMFNTNKVTDVDGKIMCSMSSVTGFTLRVFNNAAVGDCIYISSVTAGKDAVDTVAENVVTKFDNTNDLNRISLYWPTAHTVSIDNTVKHGDDNGSLKVTVATSGFNYISITNPYNTDMSAYDYVSFWIYNPGSTDFSCGTTWRADTVCAPGQWTEVKITKAMFEAGLASMNGGTAPTMANITNFVLRIDMNNNLAKGDVFYISSVRGGMNAAE